MSIPSPRRSVAPPVLAWGEGSLRVAEVVRAQQSQLQAVIGRLEAGAADDVHQGRVAARRLRSILKTFAPLIDERWARMYRMDLRSFARALGRAREADVLGAALQGAIGASDALSPAQLGRLEKSLRRSRTEARDALRKRMAEQPWRGLMKALATRSEQPPRIVRTDASMADVIALVERAWRKPKKQLERHPEDAAELHELRLALKHCRYALEVVADVEQKSATRLLRRLRRVQDAIGAHRDTVSAAQWVREHARTLGPQAVQQIEYLMIEREAAQRRSAARLCQKLLPAYEGWRVAMRPVTRAGRA